MAPKSLLQWQWLWVLPMLSAAYAKAVGRQPPPKTEPVNAPSAVGALLSSITQAPLASMDALELLKRARGLDTCGYWNGTSALVCDPGLFCSTLGREGYWHCCVSSSPNCFVPTACLDYSASRNGLCDGTAFNADRTACCSERTLGSCLTLPFRDNANIAWVGCYDGTKTSLALYQDPTTTTTSSTTPSTTTGTTTTSSVPPTPTPTPTPEPTPIAPIVGGVVGGVVALAIIAALLFYFMRRKKKSDGSLAGNNNNNNNSNSQNPPVAVAPVSPAPPTFPQGQPALVQHFPQYLPQQEYVDQRSSSIAKSPQASMYGSAGGSVFFTSPPGSPPGSPPPPRYGHASPSSSSSPGFVVPQYGAPPASELPTSRQTDTTTYEIGS